MKWLWRPLFWSLKTIIHGALWGLGFTLGMVPLLYFVANSAGMTGLSSMPQPVTTTPPALADAAEMVKNTRVYQALAGPALPDVVPFDDTDIPVNPHMDIPRNARVPIPAAYTIHQVNNSEALLKAYAKIAEAGGNGAIVLNDGSYQIKWGLTIKVPNVMIVSASNDPNKVIINGSGMRKASRVENIFRINASGFVLEGITLQQAGNHLIQIAAEKNADLPILRNCILRDAYEQLIKVSYEKNTPNVFSDAGLIEYCRFEYSAGIGPNFYIGGLDAHGIRNWHIRFNLFKDIASPSARIAEHAIHIWNNTSNNVVEGNIIVDSDRGIGFGLVNKTRHPNIRYSNLAGVIRNNLIYHSDNGDKSADTGIIIEDSPGTIIDNNMVYLANPYPRAIEYRYPSTKNVKISNNHTNKTIAARDGGQAELSNNREDLSLELITKELSARLGQLGLN
ncbi:MAG: right-handed parallel beta-helix repeat-containing protein [Paraglaciecola sp.]|nr:right-handed parallel beta-helix repeat-containing protein [Paraglaciecola sp.]NCT47328.1 right-handed parallel beta-helix repeat-containing protein [Paraglaciecola sp.]